VQKCPKSFSFGALGEKAIPCTAELRVIGAIN
jgi:hypothetical protein